MSGQQCRPTTIGAGIGTSGPLFTPSVCK